MFTCTCTCNAARRVLLASASQRHISTTATRLIRQSTVNQDEANDSKGKSTSRLSWDPANKQWIKNRTSRTPQQRPSPAERAKILAELKEQRLNEVTELSPGGNDQAAATVKQANAVDSSSTSSSSKSPEGNSTTSTSGRRYRRGQDSSTLHVSFRDDGDWRMRLIDLVSFDCEQVQTATTLEGVPIPIRPSPPESTDCCMTGCPRCVYDIYTEDLQLHFEAMDKACKELRKKGVPEEKWPIELQKFANAANTVKSKKETGPDTTSTRKQMFDVDDADGISAFDIASQVVTNEIQDLDISLRT